MINKEIAGLLMSLGFCPDKNGFVYLAEVIDKLSSDTSLTLREVYKKIMQTKKTTACTIDSSIRNAIHSAFQSGKLIRLNDKMEMDIIEQNICPSNKMLIYYLVYYLQSKLD